MPYDCEYTPPELVALQDELARHPDILAKAKDVATFTESIGLIAAEVGLLLDGTYAPEDMRTLYVILKNKLEAKRSLIILASDIPKSPPRG